MTAKLIQMFRIIAIYAFYTMYNYVSYFSFTLQTYLMPENKNVSMYVVNFRAK